MYFLALVQIDDGLLLLSDLLLKFADLVYDLIEPLLSLQKLAADLAGTNL